MKPNFLSGIKHLDFNIYVKIGKDYNIHGVARANPFPQKRHDKRSYQQQWMAGHGGEGSSVEEHSSSQRLNPTG